MSNMRITMVSKAQTTVFITLSMCSLGAEEDTSSTVLPKNVFEPISLTVTLASPSRTIEPEYMPSPGDYRKLRPNRTSTELYLGKTRAGERERERESQYL